MNDTECVLFIQDNGVPAVMFASPEALKTRSLIEIALSDVPFGKPFKIVKASELPWDKPQEEWEIDPSTLTDGVGLHGIYLTAQGDANG